MYKFPIVICTLYHHILENSYPAKHVCQNYHIFWFSINNFDGFCARTASGSVSHSLALFGRRLKFSGSCTYLPEVVVSSAGSSTTRAARHKMEKKTQLKIRAEFMTSVSYRPEVKMYHMALKVYLVRCC